MTFFCFIFFPFVCAWSAGFVHVDQKHLTRSGMIPGSWQHRMKLQLFLKASKAYYVLSDAATNLLKYGRALRYIKLSLQCYGEWTQRFNSDFQYGDIPVL